ncbi:MAG TPA: sigma-70 family RNA polymerase sigma factor [Terriglobales bacterium]|nr:sigma-70 family RNA polymerase sigma factor [Terriglobales bacterium]
MSRNDNTRELIRPTPGTLGALLYSGGELPTLELEWAGRVRAIGRGDEEALHALYQRTQRIVFTLALRITSSRETAEEVTVDVFHDVWRRAATYDPSSGGTVVGWIMNQTRSRAIDRIRFEQRKKRVAPDADPTMPRHAGGDPTDEQQRGEILRGAVAVLAQPERDVIEAAFFGGLTYAEVAARLDLPLGTVKTRIRAALEKLRCALGTRREEL